MKFEDQHFGVVDIDPTKGAYLHSVPISVNQRTAPCHLYVSSNIGQDVKRMTATLALLDRLSELDLHARQSLATEDTIGNEVIFGFIESHLEELEDQVIQKFGEIPEDHHTFLQGLELCGIGIHPTDEGGLCLRLDYSIGSLYSDELLVVTFQESGDISEITHES